MTSNLLTTRRFAPLFWCQFFSAFNDNFLKTALVFLILFKMTAEQDPEALITLAGAIFIFPFFILSAIGGEIADRYDKALVAQRLKLIEIAVAGVAVAGFWLHSVPVLFAALFLFGVISALFGPIKYGILPDHLVESELPAGNALVEGATFIAILSGTIVGGLAVQGRRRPRLLRRHDDGLLARRLDRGAVHPADRLGGAGPRHRLQHRALDRRAAARSVRPEAAVVGRPRGELVLARRRRRALAAAAARQERARRRRGGRHRLSRGVLDRDRARLGSRRLARQRPHRAHPDGVRRRAARPVRAPSRLAHPWHGGRRARARRARGARARPRPPRRHRPVRARDRRRPVHRAGLLGRAGLGGLRPPRPRRRLGERAQRRLHDGGRRRRRHCCRNTASR